MWTIFDQAGSINALFFLPWLRCWLRCWNTASSDDATCQLRSATQRRVALVDVAAPAPFHSPSLSQSLYPSFFRFFFLSFSPFAESSQISVAPRSPLCALRSNWLALLILYSNSMPSRCESHSQLIWLIRKFQFRHEYQLHNWIWLILLTCSFPPSSSPTAWWVSATVTFFPVAPEALV